MSSRWLTVLLWMGLAACGSLALTAWLSDEWYHAIDSAIYLLTAKSLAAGEGYTYLGQPFFVRPPALSFLLSPFVGEPLDFRTFNVLLNATGVATWFVVTLVLRRLHGPLLGTLAGLAFAINPLSVGFLNKIFAEYPHMLFLFGGMLLLLPDRAGRQAGWPRAAAGAVLVAASLYFRSVAMLLLPCMVLVDALRRDGRRWQGAVLAGLIALSVAPWMVYGAGAAAEADKPSSQLLMFDYKTAMFHVDPRDPDSALVDLDGWIERIQGNGVNLARYATYGLTTASFDPMSDELETPHLVVGLCVAACMLYTWLRRRSLADWYMAAYTVLLFTYFTVVDRLVLPVFPLVLSSVIYSLDHLTGWIARQFPDPRTKPGLITVVVLAYLVISVLAVGPALSEDARRKTWHRDDFNTARWLKENTAEDALVLHEKGAILTLLSGRTTYTFRNLPGPWPAGCPRVDWAIFSPRPKRESTEDLVRAAAGLPLSVPFRWMGQDSAMRVYDLRDIEQ